MTLEKIYNKWQSIQPLSEADQNKLSMRFTVEYNYNSNHLEGNTLTYGQTELLLLFGIVSGEGHLKDFNDMKASEVSVKMMKEEAANKKEPLTQNFIRTLHHTLLREDYTEYRTLPNGVQTSFVIHAGQYKTRPNSVITRYGDRFEYASPEETPALMSDLVDWYNEEEQQGNLSPVELAALFHYRYIRIQSIRGWKWTNSSFNGELYSFKTWMADDSGTKPEKTRVSGGFAPNRYGGRCDSFCRSTCQYQADRHLPEIL